ncbi:MAG: serine protein kinase RIO [Methanomicrobiales archaeon]|nr:serine protein kinase RIO [Methanomicrobiales archaeon]
MGKHHEEDFDREIEQLGVRVRDGDQRKVRDDVFDEITLLTLYHLIHKKKLTAMGGPLSTGKEANVYLGTRDNCTVAVKIYRIRTADFTAMGKYITGDRRFSRVRKTRKEIVFAWTRKEYSNLTRARDAGLLVPTPLVWDRNILIMEFLGIGDQAYPQLRLVPLNDPAAVYDQIIEDIRVLYQVAHLVHGDLSEYNILMGEKPHLIDMGQSVTPDHPEAIRFLRRDIMNINRFFSQFCDVRDANQTLSAITGIPLENLMPGGKDMNREEENR